jgi:hypothetical protein
MNSTTLKNKRLITWNLLTSAAVYQTMDYRNDPSVYDLASLINLFCLYDNVYVLKRGENDLLSRLPSDMANLLQEEEFVKNWFPSSVDEAAEISRVANAHLLTFLQEKETDKFQKLVTHALKPSAVQYGLINTPDHSDALDLARLWLQTAPDRGDLVQQLEKEEPDSGRALTFLIRTFLYLACADKAEANFWPDTARIIALEPVLKEEAQLREAILSSLEEQLQREFVESYRELCTTPRPQPVISPFAALVFERAGNDRQNIIQQMKKIRKDAAELRAQIREIDTRWQSGSAYDAAKAREDWQEVLKDVEKYWQTKNYKLGQVVLVLRWALKFTGSILELTTGIATQDLIKSLKGGVQSGNNILEFPLDALKKLVQTNTVVEMHRLLPPGEVPNPQRLEAMLDNLFGTTRG